MRRTLGTVVAAALLAGLAPARADDKDKDPSKSDLPLSLKLTAKKDTYTLAPDIAEIKKALAGAKESGRYPDPPAVDLLLTITNTSDKKVQFWASGDPVQVHLELKGPGAKSVKPRRAFTLELRLPKAMTLAPGKSHTIKINKLQWGFRGVSEQGYWLKPGEYTITASFKTAISPPPKGVKPDESGFGRVTLKSDPVKVQVKEK